jgi:hypothetical protein
MFQHVSNFSLPHRIGFPVPSARWQEALVGFEHLSMPHRRDWTFQTLTNASRTQIFVRNFDHKTDELFFDVQEVGLEFRCDDKHKPNSVLCGGEAG